MPQEPEWQYKIEPHLRVPFPELMLALCLVLLTIGIVPKLSATLTLTLSLNPSDELVFFFNRVFHEVQKLTVFN